MKILVVENDAHSAELLRHFLSPRGHEIAWVRMVEEALSLVQTREGEFGLAALDLGLPGMSGMELTRKLRALPGGKQLYILAITGNGSALALQAVLEAGADDYLVKPLDLERLSLRMFIAERHIIIRSNVKRAEEALGQAVRGWHATFDAISTPIFLTDLDGKIQRCNRALSELMGMPIAQVLGNKGTLVIRSTERLRISQVLNTVQNTSERQTMLLEQNGHWYECSIDPMPGPHGPTGSLVVMSDVTELKNAEQALGLALRGWHATFDAIGDPVFLLDEAGRIKRCNLALSQLAGLPIPRLLNQDCALLMPEVAAFSGPSFVDFVTRQRERLRGSVQRLGRYLDYSVDPMRDALGRISGAIVVIKDVTEQRAAEERLHRQELEQKRLQAEMELARSIQQSLLPARSPEVEGLEIAGLNCAATETSGDYFDYFELPDGRMGLAVADVTGHGLGPALIMCAARAYTRAQAQVNNQPDKILKAVNGLLERDLSGGNFLSLCLAAFDTQGRTLMYASAGHEPPLWYQAMEHNFVELHSTGPLLGIDREAEFDVAGPETLRSGDILVFMTDGLFECLDAKEEAFGKERLKQLIKNYACDSAQQLLETMLQVVNQWAEGAPQRDDITAVVVKVR